jgi:nucleoside-diphosphate-sugar epimerase
MFMSNNMKKISILGLGNISYELSNFLVKKEFKVSGTTNNYERKNKLQELGVKVFNRNEITECLMNSNKIIITVPPDVNGCPIIRDYFKQIVNSKIKWIGYLSSTSVYGNYNGEKVTENSDLRPANPVEISRYKGEQDIINFGIKYSVPVEVFRISGIYGKHRNVIKQILSKNITPIFKENHFFNRIHEKDIARVLSEAAYSKINSGIINLSDSFPAPQLEVINYASKIMKVRLPKSIKYKDIYNDIPESVNRFWKNNRRVDNSLLVERYGELIYPSYKEGLDYIYHDYLLTSSNKD